MSTSQQAAEVPLIVTDPVKKNIVFNKELLDILMNKEDPKSCYSRMKVSVEFAEMDENDKPITEQDEHGQVKLKIRKVDKFITALNVSVICQ